MDSTPNRQTVSFEELAYSNMLTLNALVELLAEKGLVSKREVLERQRSGSDGAKIPPARFLDTPPLPRGSSWSAAVSPGGDLPEHNGLGE